MQSTTARVGLLAAVVAVAVVLFIVLSGDDEGGDGSASTSASTGTETTAAGGLVETKVVDVVTVRDGKPVGGVQELTFKKGDEVNLEVRLDQPAEEVHVHGYEITKPAQKSPVRISFPANIDGVFEVEVHEEGGGEFEIAELKVSP